MNIELGTANECIKNLNAIRQNNEIRIKWDWPDINTGIDYVYIYEINNETETLEELQKRKAKYFSFSRKNYIQNGCYKKTAPSEAVQYRIFPVKINANNTVILNQANNITKVFKKTIIIEYSILSKATINKKLLRILFHKPELITNLEDIEIVYNKYDKNNNYICTYPLDIDLIQKEIYNISVGKGEYISLSLKDTSNDFIKFRLK